MPNLTLESADDLVDGLNIHGAFIDCPICGRAMLTSQTPEGSDFWSHFFSKKHANMRPLDPSLEDRMRAVIRRTARDAKKAERAAEAAAKKARADAQVAEDRRRRATHAVTGAFLDEIVEEMEALISMMEPYYSQANADRDARAKIAKIREISGTPLEA